VSKSSPKINFAKWSLIIGIIGIPIALIGSMAAAVTIPEIGCRLGLKLSACVVPQQVISLIVQSESGEALSGVKIQFIAQKGAPEVQYTDNNGYARAQIPSVGDVRVNLSKSGYPIQDLTINLENDQNVLRIIRFNQSGKPIVEPVTSLPSSTPISPPIEISTPSPSSQVVTSPPSMLPKTECQSATPGKNLSDILQERNNFSLTLGRELVPLLAYIGDYNARIYREEPIEMVCNLQSSYSNLKLVYGVHGGNSQSLPENRLMFSVFLDKKAVGAKEVVVGSKYQWDLNLQGVKNVSLRVECASKVCPSLSFTEMTLK
jgi:hypothetical protein